MDFDNATNWNKTFKGQPLNLVTPVSCCNTITGEFPALNYPTSTNCATNPQDADSNWKKVTPITPSPFPRLINSTI